MSAAANSARDLEDVLTDITLRVLDQQSIQRMLREVFIAVQDEDCPMRHNKVALYEGVAALALMNDRECTIISELVEEAERLLKTKAGGK
jgi:hypothetical protein